MSFRVKLILIILVAFVGLGGLYALLSRHIILGSFAELEEKLARDNAKRAASVLADEAEFIDRLVKDWAWWDGTYEFVVTRDEGYVRSSLPKETFIDQELNAILIYNASGTLVWGRFFDLEAEQWTPIPETFESALTRNPELVRLTGEDDARVGLLDLDGGLFAMSCRPILTSENKGPARGSLLMGRYVTDSLIAEMGERNGMNMRLASLSDRRLPEDLRRIADRVAASPEAWIHETSGKTMRCVKTLTDIFGRPAALLVIDSPREVHALGRAVVVNNLLALSLGGLLLMAGVYLFLERRIISRVVSLSRIADSALSQDGRAELVHLSGEDELAAVSRTLGSMAASLRESQGFLSTMLDNLEAGVILIDPESHRVVEANQHAAKLTGASREEIIGRSCRGLACPADMRGCPLLDGRVQPGQAVVRTLQGPDGRERRILKTGTKLSREGRPYILETFIDVTELERAKEALDESERLYRTVFMNTGAASLLVDGQGTVLMANEGFAALTGLDPAQSEGRLRWQVLFPPEEMAKVEALAEESRALGRNSFSMEATLSDVRGRPHHVLLTWAGVPDSDRRVLSMVDLTDQKRYQHELYNKAYYDQLTGLPNRTLFTLRLGGAISRTRISGQGVAVMLLDLDDFKNVNDTLGHHAGDGVVRETGRRMAAAVGDGDFVARLGGDEFVILVEHDPGEGLLALMAERILGSFAEPYVLSGREVFISTSMGIARFPDDGDDADTVLKHAELAMYEAKATGKNSYKLFSSDMNARLQRKVSLEADLRRAVRDRSFVVHYQPIVDVRDCRIVGVEALLRWVDPQGRIAPPARFIPVAEEIGLMADLDRIALEIACGEVEEWRLKGKGLVRLSVNLSAQSLARGDMESVISDVLRRTGFPAPMLSLEITETALIKDLETATARLLDVLGARGIGISLDDFGTGYSSLAYLKHLPIDVLKIDRMFVSDIGDESDDGPVLVRSMISLAQNMGLRAVAEGVETVEQLEFLREHDCAMAQGYLFSPPVPGREFKALLANKVILPRPADVENSKPDSKKRHAAASAVEET